MDEFGGGRIDVDGSPISSTLVLAPSYTFATTQICASERVDAGRSRPKEIHAEVESLSKRRFYLSHYPCNVSGHPHYAVEPVCCTLNVKMGLELKLGF